MTTMTDRKALITEGMRDLLMLHRQLQPDTPDWERRMPLIAAFSMLTAKGDAGATDRMDSMNGLLDVLQQEGITAPGRGKP